MYWTISGSIVSQEITSYGGPNARLVARSAGSSRFWPADAWVPGRAQPSYDKQIVRNWLLSADSGWDRAAGGPPPALPAEVVERTRSRYQEAFELLTGQSF